MSQAACLLEESRRPDKRMGNFIPEGNKGPTFFTDEDIQDVFEGHKHLSNEEFLEVIDSPE